MSSFGQQIIVHTRVRNTSTYLPHFLEHYSRLGVDGFLISSNHALDSQAEWQKRFPVTFFRSVSEEESREAAGAEWSALDHLGVRPSDWILPVDLDEFHQYPLSLRDILALMVAQRIDVLLGRVYDRLSSDGRLKPVEVGRPLTEQFELGGSLTEHLLGARPWKVMIARREQLSEGKIATLAETNRHRFPFGLPQDYRIHRFCWVTDVGAGRNVGNHGQSNSSKSASSIEKSSLNVHHAGKIELSDARLQIHRAGSFVYPEPNRAVDILASLPRDKWQIDDADVAVLTAIARAVRPRRILEFGPGRSTLLWSILGCEVDTFEHDSEQLERDRALLQDLGGVHLYSYRPPITGLITPAPSYDLAFVDGPYGSLYRSQSRLDAVLCALQRSNTVILHDSRRKGEQETLDAVRLLGHHVESFNTPRGIGLIRRAAFRVRQRAPHKRSAVVVLSWNDFENLRETLQTFHHFNRGLDIYVVDNGSSDATFGFLKSDVQYNVIRHQQNLGVFAGTLSGWGRALTDGYDFILNLQSDFPCIGPVPFRALEEYLDRNSDVGFVRLNDKAELRQNAISGQAIQTDAWQPLDDRYRIAKYNYHMSFNPCFLRSSLVPLFLNSSPRAERGLMAAFESSGNAGAKITPFCFHTRPKYRHDTPGWRS